MANKKNIPPLKKAPAKKKPATGKRRTVKVVPVLTEEEQKALDEEKQLQEHEKKRADWERNNIAISAFFLKACMKKNAKMPSYAQIAAGCGINERTVRRHFEQSKIFGDQTQKIQMLRDQSLLTIAVKAIKGEAVEWNRLLHQIVDGIGGLGGVSIKTNASSTPAAAPTSQGKLEIETTLQIS